MAEQKQMHRKAVVGNINSSFWLYDSVTGFDLTHPATPTSPTVHNAVHIQTTKYPILVDPAKSALVIIDMQNFFLSTTLGRSPQSKGLAAQEQLLSYAIPAARKAGMRIFWLNWGLTDNDLKSVPAATFRAFGFETVHADYFEPYVNAVQKHEAQGVQGSENSLNSYDSEVEDFGKKPKIYIGLGNQMGPVALDDGTTIEAGRMLMHNQWNTALTPQLDAAYREGLRANPPDMWISKNRISGFSSVSTCCTNILDPLGIKTLFFAGVNTDQCVGGTMTDAFSRGYDCILLCDGAATSSPQGSQETWEFNAAGTYGFVTTCKKLWDGVENAHL